MAVKKIVVELSVEEEVEEWDGYTSYSYGLLDDFRLVSSEVPREGLVGLAESLPQSDRYYEIIQNLPECFDKGD